MNFCKNPSLLLAFFALWLTNVNLSAANTVKVGNSVKVYCTATPPSGGWITHAFFELVDPNDSKYVGYEYNSYDCYATFYGLSPKSNIKIQVTYAYSFKGTYDDNIHVGSASYYDYITVTGAPAPTDIKIVPNNVHMKVGETTNLKVELVPSNASGDYDWGTIVTLSSPPSYYSISKDGDIISVTAKKPMTVYLLVQLPNGKAATCIVKATKDGDDQVIPPTAIALKVTNSQITVGESIKVNYSLVPAEASTTLTWTSSNTQIATIDDTGTVKALKPGIVKLTGTTSNGLSASTEVKVISAPSSISLPTETTMFLGYGYLLTPSVKPTDANPTFTWKSSDTSVASVSGGTVTAYKEGDVTISVTTTGGLAAQTKVKIIRPADELNYRNVSPRLTAIKNLIIKSVATEQ